MPLTELSNEGMEITKESPLSKGRLFEIESQMESYSIEQCPGFTSDRKEYGFFAREVDTNRTRGSVVGWCWMGSIHIHRLFVDESLRGIGIGTKLMDKVEELAHIEKCTLITTETLSLQKALQFYLNKGYQVAFHDKGYSLGMSIYYLRKKI